MICFCGTSKSTLPPSFNYTWFSEITFLRHLKSSVKGGTLRTFRLQVRLPFLREQRWGEFQKAFEAKDGSSHFST